MVDSEKAWKDSTGRIDMSERVHIPKGLRETFLRTEQIKLYRLKKEGGGSNCPKEQFWNPKP
jgi:hypothetical protein